MEGRGEEGIEGKLGRVVGDEEKFGMDRERMVNERERREGRGWEGREGNGR